MESRLAREPGQVARVLGRSLISLLRLAIGALAILGLASTATALYVGKQWADKTTIMAVKCPPERKK